MMKRLLFSSILYTFILLLTVSSAHSDTDSQRVGPVEVSLVSENLSIQPGVPFEIGLYIQPDEHWHVYWKNPGDAGLPPTLKFELPEGFESSEIIFPPPHRIDFGPLTSYGYHGDVLYPVIITPSKNLKTGDFIIDVTAEWLVCKEECLPGMAKLSLTLPIKNETPQPNKQFSELFENNRSINPITFPENNSAQTTLTENEIYIDFSFSQNFSDSLSLQFFPSEKAIIKHSSEQILTKVNNSYRLKLERSPYSNSDPEKISGVLEISDGDYHTNYNISLDVGSQSENLAVTSTASADSSFSLLYALLFAFAGGLILNLMPCVLPVLSLKVLGLINQASHGRKNSFMHGLFFTFGVVASFWVIVALMFILQAGGAQLGWGFQLQSPTFVMILAAGMFLFGLSLFGLFEVSFLTGAAGSLSSAQKGRGLSAAFVSGITATLVATPCTAPFMGAALGYSLTQPMFTSFLIYTFLAIGMAAPYLVLAIFPNLLKFVPKPGAWMETLKQAMGFMLMATVIWLGWVLVSLAGPNSLVILLAVLLLVSIGAWIYGRFGSLAASSKARLISSSLAIILIFSSILFGHETINKFRTTSEFNQSSENGIPWEKFSQTRLDELLEAGQPVFIDFTAAWCLSCQVNEQVALNTEDVIDRFKQLNITPLKADWTNRSEEITKALASYGRNSVPVYIIYGSGTDSKPIMLPEILTTGIVLDALDKIEKTDNL